MSRGSSGMGGVLASCLLAIPMTAGAASAARLFVSEIRSGPQVAVNSTNSAQRIPDLFDARVLPVILSGYQPATDPFSARLDLRGLSADLTWDPGTGLLTLSALGESVSFSQPSLELALEDLDAWLEGDLEVLAASLTLTDLLQGLVEHSPVDPVAGNPNSLQSRFFQTDFRLGTQSGLFDEQAPVEGWNHSPGVGLEYGYASAGSYDVHAIDLPIEYRVDLPDPKWSLLFSLPITATFTQDQWSILASAGAGVQYRPIDWWSLTPMARIGGVGSLDVGALAILYSATITSEVRHQWRGITFSMGNLFGFTKTVDGIEIGDYDVTYDLTNPVLTNGLSMTGDTGLVWRDRRVGWTLFGSNTQIFGDAVYMDSQTEIGGRLGWGNVFRGAPDYARSIELSYLFGNGDYDALSLRVRLLF